MALTLIGAPQKHRIQNGFQVSGYAQFTTTSLTGELPIDPEISRLTAPPQVKLINGPSHILQVQLGAISATRPFSIYVPYAGIISKAVITGDATSAAHSTTILDWHMVNLGLAGAGTAVVIDRALTGGANTTDSDVAGATDLTADVPKVLGLTATTADKTVVVGDVLDFVWTVTGGTAQTSASLNLWISQDGSTGDEYIWVDESSLITARNNDSPGLLSPAFNNSLSPVQRAVTVNRFSTNPKSGAIFSFFYEGF